MAKLFSNNPLFVDLFYGVVVGSAIASLSLKDLDKMPYQIVWVLAVLEDWYLYYRHVLDEEEAKVSFSFKSLVIEFSILVSWFLGFQALKEENQENHFFFFFGTFYVIKVLAGVSFYAKHRQLLSKRMLYDSLWIIMPLTAWSLARWGGRAGWPFSKQFWVVGCVTTCVLGAWWILITHAPPRRPTSVEG